MEKNQDLSVPASFLGLTGVLEHGCEFEGKLTFLGTLRVGGRFKGQIFTPDTLVIGEGAQVEAEVEAGTVIISGEFVGNVRATHRVEIHKPGVFRGNILTPSLSVDEGVVFEGSSKMAHSISPPRNPIQSADFGKTSS